MLYFPVLLEKFKNFIIKRQSTLLMFLKYGVSIGLIAFILLRANLNSAFSALLEVNTLMFVYGLFVMAFGLMVRSYKWKLLLKVQGVEVPALKLMNFYFISFFFNNLFLGSFGGDAYRFYSVIGYSGSKSDAASSVIMERSTGFFAGLLLLLVIGIGFVFSQQTFVSVRLLVVLMLIGLIAGLIMFVFASLKAEHLNWPILEKVSKLTNLLDKLAASIRRYNNHRKSLFVALILSFLHHFAQSLTVYYFVIAVSPEVSFLPIIFVSLLAGFLIMIPISLNGLGIQEGTYIFYLEQLGVAAPNALIIALLVRAAILIFSLIGGFLSLIHDQGLRKVPENNNTSVNKT